MRPRTGGRHSGAPALVLALTLGAALAGACSSSGSRAGPGAGATASQNPAANTLEAVLASFDLAAGPPTRVMLGLQTGDGRLVGFGTVQVRVHPLDASTGSFVTATFVAVPGTQTPRPEPAGAAVVDAVHGRGVYAFRAGFDQPGVWTADVRATVQGLGAVTASTQFQVLRRHGVVAVGDHAPASSNPTIAFHSGVPLSAVDSRAQGGNPVSDPALHATTVAAALAAHRPVVVVVSTPVYCTSRFCGPTTDMVDALAKQYAKRAAFVHIEVWENYQNQQVSPAAAQWILRGPGDGTEPWVFVVGSDGIVKARFDNVVTRADLVAALDQYAP